MKTAKVHACFRVQHPSNVLHSENVSFPSYVAVLHFQIAGHDGGHSPFCDGFPASQDRARIAFDCRMAGSSGHDGIDDFCTGEMDYKLRTIVVRPMDAIVEIINQTRGMIAARSADGEFVILEILASAIPEKGDVVSHADFHSMGRETYRNKTQGTDLDVFVQNIVGSIDAAKKQCFLTR